MNAPLKKRCYYSTVNFDFAALGTKKEFTNLLIPLCNIWSSAGTDYKL